MSTAPVCTDDCMHGRAMHLVSGICVSMKPAQCVQTGDDLGGCLRLGYEHSNSKINAAGDYSDGGATREQRGELKS